MMEGKVEGLFVAPVAAAPIESVERVTAVEGRGLEGDRYFKRIGTYSDTPGTGRHVTLIEREAIEALALEDDVVIEPSQARRNVLTSGVSLNHLVGQEFAVGEVVLRGMRLCEPCAHMERLSKRGALKGLIHRGGLRAEIVSGGVIRLGDGIRTLSDRPHSSED
jgi:MOSC domain-containing protein YiiM